MKINNGCAEFLRTYDWNYFITCRTHHKVHLMTARNWINKLISSSYKVENIFYVSESDKGDHNNKHVHMLIDTNTDMTYKEIRFGLGNVSVGDYQPIYNKDEVCKYVVKHFGKDVDYDIVFKEKS